MSRELFKKTFLPLGIDESTIYNWYIDGDRRWHVYREGYEGMGVLDMEALDMKHVATTRGKDELVYFTAVFYNYDPKFENFDIIIHDDSIRYALDIDDVYRILPAIDSDKSPKVTDNEKVKETSLEDYRPVFKKLSDKINNKCETEEEILTRKVKEKEMDRRVFSSGLQVFLKLPDEYVSHPKYEEHLYSMLDMHELYYTKNKDYGDAFTQSLDKYGPIAALVRMEDKWNRLSNLITKGEEGLIKSESVEDTLIDLANYAIMTSLYLRGNKTDD